MKEKRDECVPSSMLKSDEAAFLHIAGVLGSLCMSGCALQVICTRIF